MIPGGSGYLGTHLADRLVARGDQVVVLTRGADHDGGRGLRRVHWDGTTVGDWVSPTVGRGIGVCTKT